MYLPYLPKGLRVPKITLAACAFAVILYKVITSPMVQNGLTAVLRKALNTAF